MSPCRMPKNRLTPEEHAHRLLTGVKRIYLSLESIESILMRITAADGQAPILRNLEDNEQISKEMYDWHVHGTPPDSKNS